MRTALVVDAYAPFRRSVGDFLTWSKRFRVIGEAASGHEAFIKLQELRPDMVFISLDLPDMGGLDAAKKVLKDYPKCMVVLIGSDGEEYHRVAKKVGALIFVTRDELFQLLRELVESNDLQADGVGSGGLKEGKGLRR